MSAPILCYPQHRAWGRVVAVVAAALGVALLTVRWWAPRLILGGLPGTFAIEAAGAACLAVGFGVGAWRHEVRIDATRRVVESRWGMLAAVHRDAVPFDAVESVRVIDIATDPLRDRFAVAVVTRPGTAAASIEDNLELRPLAPVLLSERARIPLLVTRFEGRARAVAHEAAAAIGCALQA